MIENDGQSLGHGLESVGAKLARDGVGSLNILGGWSTAIASKLCSHSCSPELSPTAIFDHSSVSTCPSHPPPNAAINCTLAINRLCCRLSTLRSLLRAVAWTVTTSR